MTMTNLRKNNSFIISFLFIFFKTQQLLTSKQDLSEGEMNLKKKLEQMEYDNDKLKKKLDAAKAAQVKVE